MRGDQDLISSFRFPFLRNCKLTLLVSPTNNQKNESTGVFQMGIERWVKMRYWLSTRFRNDLR